MPVLQKTLPSGLSGEIRGLKGREIKKLGESQNPYFDVLDGCWLKTLAAGPYVLHDGERPRWTEVLSGDIMTALLAVSEATFGAKRVVNWPCESHGCRSQVAALNATPIDVTKNIAIRPLAPEMLAAFRDGNRIEAVVDGKRLWHRLATGADIAAAFARAGKGKPDIFEALERRIVEIEGVRDFPQDRIAWLEELELADLRAFGKTMNSRECGPEQTFQTQCAFCKLVQDVPIPFIDLLIQTEEEPTV